MKKKITTVTEEYDKDGTLKSRITETAEEEDEGYIYPQYPVVYPSWPSYPSTGNPIIYKTDVTCEAGASK